MDDLESWTDKAVHGVESAGAKATGALADAASWIGDSGDAAALNWLSRNLADAAGDEIPEKQLGETKDPKELVHGDATAIGKAVGELRKMQTSTDEAGTALKKIDTADWTGEAADSFHTEFGKHPALWGTASDAMKKAADALDAWGHEVTAAQKKAGLAVDLWDQADKDKKTKTDWWNSQSQAYKDKHSLASIDSWSTTYQDARDMLGGARADRDNAANTAVTALREAMNEAPEVPSFTDRMKADLSDASDVWQDFQLDFDSGLLSSVGGLVQFVRQIDPTDPYNLTHPAQYVTGLTDLYAGMVVAGSDPGAVVSSMWNDATNDPGHALGNLTGQVVIGLATGGGTAAETVTAEVADTATELSTNAARVAAEDASTAADQAAVNATRDVAAAAPKPEIPEAQPDLGSSPAADTHPTSAAPGTEAPTGAPSPSGEAPPAENVPGDTHSGSTDTGAPNNAPAQPDSPAPGGETPAPNPDHSAGTDPGASTDMPAHTDSPAPGSDAPPPNADRPVSSDPGGPTEAPAQPDSPAPASDSPAPNGEQPQVPDGSRPTEPSLPADTMPGSEHPAPASTTEPVAPHDSPHPTDGSPSPEHPATGDNPSAGEPAKDPAHEPSTPETRNAVDQDANSVARDNNHETDRSDDQTPTCKDPVDIATGEFLLPETDIDLPGVLPLRLGRRHRSSYRFGRWFGRSWSCTLDQRIVVEHEGVTFLGEDGIMLAYPHAAVGEAVVPVTGNKHITLTRTETGGYRIHDEHRELVWHFAPEPGLDSLDSRLGNYAVSAITDRHRNRIRFHYNSNGEPIEVSHSGGYRVLVDADNGRVTRLAIVDRGTPVMVREFTYTAGELTSVTNGVGALTRFTYDEHHRMTSWTDSNGNQMVNTYNEAGQVIRQRGIGGVLDADYDYLRFADGTGSLTTVTSTDGGVDTYGFDEDLRLRDHVNPVGARTHTDYNSERRPLRVIAPDGAVTSYTYTGDGDVAQITRPDGATIRVEYGTRGRPTKIVDADGSIRQQEWTKNGDLAAVVTADGARTEFAYHPTGALAATTDAIGGRTTVEADGAGLPVTIVDNAGAGTYVERDGFGRPITVADALQQVTRYEWSPSGKLLRRTDPDGNSETWTYDGEGNQLTHTNRSGGTISLRYGAFDQLLSRTDLDGSVTRYLWDRERRLTGVVNPLGQRWTYEYDRAGQLKAETNYSGATIAYHHDSAGRVAATTAASGITKQHTYDILGRLTDITATTGEYKKFTYDRVGRILTAICGVDSEPIHTLINSYTSAGLLETQQLDDQQPMRHEYDSLGRRIRRITPSGGVSGWTYDSIHRIRALDAHGHRINFNYDRLGRTTGWRIGELDIHKTFDPAGRVASQTVTAFPASSLDLNFGDAPRPAPSTVRHDEYAYRPDGYLTTHTLRLPEKEPEERRYEIDSLGRVATIHNNSALTEAYVYDPLSNITRSLPEPPDASSTQVPMSSADDPDNDGKREYHNNLLIRSGRNRYYYDSGGRLIRRVTKRLSRKPAIWHFRYNAFDQLIDVWTPDERWWRYTYDALGRRVSKQHLNRDGISVQRFEYIWDNTRLVEEHGDSSSTEWAHLPHTHIPITERRSTNGTSTGCAIAAGLSGAPNALIDINTMTVMGTSRADLWGDTTWQGTMGSAIRLPGQFYDSESGLHYNLHRFYDPGSGRYLTQDPLGLSPSSNPSTYPRNPLRWCDPLGLVPNECTPTVNGGSWDPNESPYLYRGVPYGDQGSMFPHWQRAYENAQNGIAEPVGGEITDAGLHAGGRTDSIFTSWTTDYDTALAFSQDGAGPGIVLRIPNADGIGYARVPGVSYAYQEYEVTIEGTVKGAETSYLGGPWTETK
ncbi:putative T7SS-secreted protein [Nocardia stercoris]|uniref:Type IV secretion protein Rhs n=1 Tax=Nocardia stercoris TaxID=2483361 RepID=A0A3M2L4S3_9NOCA|nr:DUF6531 domain-containing protein [Nocardia stercoris]RMI32647.1 hypothetical protein EBN03_11790 [Nocardia stercoris]